MIKISCELKLKDGSKIEASLKAASPQGQYPIIYSGAVEKLPRRFEKGGPPDLKIFFQNLARELNAELSVKEEGQYDSWAR